MKEYLEKWKCERLNAYISVKVKVEQISLWEGLNVPGEVEYCGLGVAALSLSIDVVVVDEAGVVGAVGVVAEVQL